MTYSKHYTSWDSIFSLEKPETAANISVTKMIKLVTMTFFGRLRISSQVGKYLMKNKTEKAAA
jgi:hypothetical protein